MENITVNKVELLTKLKANRAAHRVIFEEALVGYRESAIAIFDKNLQAAREGKKFQASILIPQPQDQTRDYDRAIAMLEMAIGDTIELEEQDFRQYVMDDWSWKQNFLHSNSAYSSTATAFLAQTGA